jgi:PAS domain S-box-containing protein
MTAVGERSHLDILSGTPLSRLRFRDNAVKALQAVSVEIVLDRLIKTLMTIALEHAGAERGLLILLRGDTVQIEAEARTDDKTIEVTLRQEPVASAALPEAVLHTVIRTQHSVILDDASAQSPFAADAYVRQTHARSVLCLPLVKQAKLIGALYLENSLAPHVFTPARISVLELLASQAAISLENACLYRDLAEREARIRRLVDANIIGIVIFTLDGQIAEANEAFLRMVGYDRADLVAGRLRWTERTPPEWRDRDAGTAAELKMIGAVQPFEKEYFRKDGSRVPVLIGSVTLEESETEGVAFVLDLTERKRAEAEARESERATRGADGAGAREPRRDDRAAHRLDRP